MGMLLDRLTGKTREVPSYLAPLDPAQFLGTAVIEGFNTETPIASATTIEVGVGATAVIATASQSETTSPEAA